jgi:hypothetical protein
MPQCTPTQQNNKGEGEEDKEEVRGGEERRKQAHRIYGII